MQRFAAAAACVLVSLGAWAQTIATHAGDSETGLVKVVPEAPSAIVVQVPPAEKPKLFDRSFKIWMTASFAATVADVESTAHGIAACGLVERNPLLGESPSRGRMYAIGLPATAGYNLLGMWVKRLAPKSRLWMWIPGAMMAVHAGAAGHNYALCH